MNRESLLTAAGRWFRRLLWLYPPDFRDDLGLSLTETYKDRASAAFERSGAAGVAAVCSRALLDALWNGPAERLRPSVLWRRTGNWARDAELASRRLLRAPAMALAIVGTLTIGLGMVAVVYAVVHKILIEPMPYREPDDLYFVWRDYRAYFDLGRGWLGGTDVAELQKTGGVIESAAGLLRQPMTFSVHDDSNPVEIAVMVTSPNLFELLGVAPVIGRGFAPNEAGPGRPPLIVLTHDLWNRLGADRAMLGAQVRLNGQPHTVIGVMPPHFNLVRNASLGPPQPADAYVTFAINLAETQPGAGSYAGLVRARRGTPPQTVAAAVDAVGRTIDARDFKNRGLKLYPVGLKTDLVAPVRPALLGVGLAGIFLVLVLMVNLGSVLLARTAQREHEFAVSRALGANSAAVVRAMISEGGLLGLAGGVGGALAATWATRTLIALTPLDLPRRESIVVDLPIAMVVAGAGLLVGLLAAVPPAVWAARTSLASVLASSAVRGGGGQVRMRQGLIVVQVALTLVLLCSGGLVVRSFERLLRADPGFKPDGLLTFRVPIPPQFVPEARDVLTLQERVEQAFATLPGVLGVSATSALPLTASASQNTVTIPGAPGITGNADKDRPLVDYMGIRARYVEVLGMRLVSGRSFEAVRRNGVREALIDVSLARQFFPTGDPLGATIPFGRDQSLTVVGVVEQARLYSVHQDGRPQLYVRAEDFSYRNLSFVLRSQRDPQALIHDVQAAVRRIDPRLAVAGLRTMDQIVSDALRQQRVSTVLIVSFALGALILATMGLFGVVSGLVTRRRHEFAVRLALGADHHNVVRMVLRGGARLVAVGVLIGAPGVYLTGLFLRGILVGVSRLDPLTLTIITGGLVVVALAACYVPARRLLALNPAQSLRQ